MKRPRRVTPELLWRRHVKFLSPLESRFAADYRKAMGDLREAIRTSGKSPFPLEAWKKKVAAAMSPAYRAAIVAGGRQFLISTPSIRQKIAHGFMTKARRKDTADIVSSLESDFQSRIEETVSTTWDSLKGVLDEAVADNLDPDEVSDLIDEEWDDVLGRRTDSIALTETNGAVNSVRDYLSRVIVELQSWVTAADERVRATHVIYGEAGPKPVGFDWAQLADDAGYTLRFPCDPECHEPAEIVNCRCMTVPEGELDLTPEELADYLQDFEMDPEDLMNSEDQVPKGFTKEFDPDQPRDEYGRWTDIFGNSVPSDRPAEYQDTEPGGAGYASDPEDASQHPGAAPRMLDSVYEKKAAEVEARKQALTQTVVKDAEARREKAQAELAVVNKDLETFQEEHKVAFMRAEGADAAFKTVAEKELGQDRIEYAQITARGQALTDKAMGGGTLTEAEQAEVAAIADRQDALNKKWTGDVTNEQPILRGLDFMARNASGEDLGRIATAIREGKYAATGYPLPTYGGGFMTITDQPTLNALADAFEARADQKDVALSIDSFNPKLNELNGIIGAADIEIANADKVAETKAMVEAGVDFIAEKAMRDDSFYHDVHEQTADAWKHIGGRGPITLRLAAAEAFGTEGGAFDSKLGRFVTDPEKDYPGITDEAKVWAGALRREYAETQQEIADGFTFHIAGDDIDTEALSEMEQEAWNNLSTSDKVDYIEGDKKLKEEALNWGLDNEEEVVKYANENSSDEEPQPYEYVDAKTAREIVPTESEAIVDKVNRYKNGRDDDGEESDLGASYRKLDRDLDSARDDAQLYAAKNPDEQTKTMQAAAMPATLGRLQRMSDAIGTSEDSPLTWDIARAAALVEAKKFDAALPHIDRLNGEFRQWAGGTLKDFKSDVIPEIDASSLQDKNESAYEAFDEAHREWLDPYYLEAYAEADPDNSVYQKFTENFEPDQYPQVEAEEIEISPSDWPLKLNRTVSADVDNYTPNHAESWSYDVQHFGSNKMSESVDPARVLVFQGAKNWTTPKGQASMGSRENEFILLASVPKFVKEARERHAKIQAGQARLRESRERKAKVESLMTQYRQLQRLQDFGTAAQHEALKNQIEAEAGSLGLEWDDLVSMARSNA